MYGIFVQLVILVAITQGLRALGHLAGPRCCGLVLGLPSTTALMLLFCGHEHGVGEAMTAAESSLLGLVAAAMLPLAYARAIRAGARPIWALTSAIAGYVAVAIVFRALPDVGAVARVGISIAGVLTACYFAGRVRLAGEGLRLCPGRWLRSLVLGTTAPAA